MTWRKLVTAVAVCMTGIAFAQEPQPEPTPPRKDIPYLLEAQKLVDLEVQKATESKTKQGVAFSVAGTSSKARTPLPEPIFLFSPDKISADQLLLYHFDVREGRRATRTGKSDADEDEDLRLTLRPLNGGVYRIEASHMLSPGEYALYAQGTGQAFCFAVY